MKKHTILFLAANPSGTNRLALDQEVRAIYVELERSGYRDCFKFETRWAAEPLDLLRELRKLKPTVVHFSGHGDQGGLYFQDTTSLPQVVTTEALEATFGAAGASVQLVVLSACYTEPQAEALIAHVDSVVGTRGSILDVAARSFAVGFYGGLGERASVAAAYKQGCAAISLEGASDGPHSDDEDQHPLPRKERDRPQLKVRAGVNADRFIPAAIDSDSESEGNKARNRFQTQILRYKNPAAIASGIVLLGIWAYLGPREYKDDIANTTQQNTFKNGRGSEVNGRLEIDDVLVRAGKRYQTRTGPQNSTKSICGILIDVRIRNSGNATVNLTRARLMPVESRPHHNLCPWSLRHIAPRHSIRWPIILMAPSLPLRSLLLRT